MGVAQPSLMTGSGNEDKLKGGKGFPNLTSEPWRCVPWRGMEENRVGNSGPGPGQKGVGKVQERGVAGLRDIHPDGHLVGGGGDPTPGGRKGVHGNKDRGGDAGSPLLKFWGFLGTPLLGCFWLPENPWTIIYWNGGAHTFLNLFSSSENFCIFACSHPFP